MKNGLGPVPEENAAGNKLLFYLSPNDLVYVPGEEEIINDIDNNYKISSIYKIVSFTSKRLYVVPYYVSKSIVDKVEYTQLNKLEFTMEKDRCVPLKVDRLGNITYIGTEFLPKRKS